MDEEQTPLLVSTELQFPEEFTERIGQLKGAIKQASRG